jgi:hypothetical protein
MIVRRVVTGHDKAGKSVLLDRRSNTSGEGIQAYARICVEYRLDKRTRSSVSSANEPDVTVSATSLHADPGGSVFMIITFPPDSVMARADFDRSLPVSENLSEVPGIAERFEPDALGMHRTDTLDYAVVLSGEIWLELDDGEARRIVESNAVVQQGTRHAWRSKSDKPATLAFCMLGRHSAR